MTKTKDTPAHIPKGAYSLPDGNFAVDQDIATTASGRAMRLTYVVKAEPDMKPLARALLQMAKKQLADEETDAGRDELAA